jgi:hypothetical protein
MRRRGDDVPPAELMLDGKRFGSQGAYLAALAKRNAWRARIMALISLERGQLLTVPGISAAAVRRACELASAAGAVARTAESLLGPDKLTKGATGKQIGDAIGKQIGGAIGDQFKNIDLRSSACSGWAFDHRGRMLGRGRRRFGRLDARGIRRLASRHLFTSFALRPRVVAL